MEHLTMDHLNPEEILQMPLHMQILYYLERWGTLAQSSDALKRAG